MHSRFMFVAITLAWPEEPSRHVQSTKSLGFYTHAALAELLAKKLSLCWLAPVSLWNCSLVLGTMNGCILSLKSFPVQTGKQ